MNMRLYVYWYPVEKNHRYVFEKLQVIVCIRSCLRDIPVKNDWLFLTFKKDTVFTLYLFNKSLKFLFIII